MKAINKSLLILSMTALPHTASAVISSNPAVGEKYKTIAQCATPDKLNWNYGDTDFVYPGWHGYPKDDRWWPSVLTIPTPKDTGIPTVRLVSATVTPVRYDFQLKCIYENDNGPGPTSQSATYAHGSLGAKGCQLGQDGFSMECLVEQVKK